MIRAPLTLGPKARLAGALAGGGLLVALSLAGLYLPVMQRIQHRRAAIQDLHAKIVDTTHLLPHLPEHERAFHDHQERFAAFSAQFGTGDSLAGMLDILRDRALHQHLELTVTQSPQEPQAAGTLTLGPGLVLQPVPMTLRLVGRYRHLGEFLGALEELPFLVDVQRMTITQQAESGPHLEATVNLTLYVVATS